MASATGFALDQELFDNDWYLQNIIIDNVDHIPNNIGVHLTVSFREDTPNVYTIHYWAVHINSGEIEFIANEPQFRILDLVGLTQDICNGGNLICLQYASLYQHFYSDFLLTVMEYGIIDESNGSKSLIITRENGDQAIYNTTRIVLGVNEFSTFEFKLHPNPTSNKLSFSSEIINIHAITIYDLTGRRVLNQPNTTTQ